MVYIIKENYPDEYISPIGYVIDVHFIVIQSPNFQIMVNFSYQIVRTF